MKPPAATCKPCSTTSASQPRQALDRRCFVDRASQPSSRSSGLMRTPVGQPVVA
jgi:hypothetical protein